MKKFKITLFSVLLGAILGYLLYYYFFIEVLALFFTDGFFYLAISVTFLIMSIAGCSTIIYILFQKRISKWMLILFKVTYIVAMLIILFGREEIGHIAVLNPIIGLSEMNNLEMLVESALNLAIFIPVGFFLKDMKKITAIILAFLLSIGIETIQYVTMRGIFDTLDIILYVFGIIIGTFIFRKIDIKTE